MLLRVALDSLLQNSPNSPNCPKIKKKTRKKPNKAKPINKIKSNGILFYFFLHKNICSPATHMSQQNLNLNLKPNK